MWHATQKVTRNTIQKTMKLGLQIKRELEIDILLLISFLKKGKTNL